MRSMQTTSVFTYGVGLGMAVHLLVAASSGNGEGMIPSAMTHGMSAPRFAHPKTTFTMIRRQDVGVGQGGETGPQPDVAVQARKHSKLARAIDNRDGSITDATPFLLSPPVATADPIGVDQGTTSSLDWWPYTNDGGTFTAESASATVGGSEVTLQMPMTTSSVASGVSTSSMTNKTPGTSSSASQTDITSTATLTESSGSSASASTGTPAPLLNTDSTSSMGTKMRRSLGLIVPIAFGVLFLAALAGWFITSRRRKMRKAQARASLLLAGEQAFDEDEHAPGEIKGMGKYRNRQECHTLYVPHLPHRTNDGEPDAMLDEKSRMLLSDAAGNVSQIRGQWATDDDGDGSRRNPYALKRATELTHAFGWRETIHRAQGKADAAMTQASSRQVGLSGLGHGISNGMQDFRRRISGPSDEAVYQRLGQAESAARSRVDDTPLSASSAATPTATSSPRASSKTVSADTPESPLTPKSGKQGRVGFADRLFQRSKAIHPTHPSPGAFEITPRKGGDELIAGKAYSEIPAGASPPPRLMEKSPSRSRAQSRKEIMPHGGTPNAQLLSPELQPAMFFAPMDGLGLRSPANTITTLEGREIEPSPDLSMYSDATGITGMGGAGFSGRGLQVNGLRSPGETSILPTPRDKVGARTFPALPPSQQARATASSRTQNPTASVRVKPSSRPPPGWSALKTASGAADCDSSARSSPTLSPAACRSSQMRTTRTVSRSPVTPTDRAIAFSTTTSETDSPRSSFAAPPSAFDRRSNRALGHPAPFVDSPIARTARPAGLTRTSAFHGLSSSGTPLIIGDSAEGGSGGKTGTSVRLTPDQTANGELRRAPTVTLGSSLQRRMDLVRKAELKDVLGGPGLEKRISDAAHSRKHGPGRAQGDSPGL